jgi:hypothetical protein
MMLEWIKLIGISACRSRIGIGIGLAASDSLMG